MSESAEEQDSNKVLDLYVEYKLTIAWLLSTNDTTCADYFAARKNTLIPYVLEIASNTGVDPIELFYRYTKRVHLRLCVLHAEGQPTPIGDK